MAEVGSKKSILLSIKPPYTRAIIEGSKTIELRRKFNKSIMPGTRVILYATSPIKEIVGECYIKEVMELPLNELWKCASREAMIDWNSFRAYFTGCKKGYGIVVHKVMEYEKPISLSKMRSKYQVEPPQSYQWVDSNLM